MRFTLRKVGAALTAGSIIFSLSCERHHLGELPTQESEVKASEGKSKAHGGHQPGEAEHPAHSAAGRPNDPHRAHGDAAAGDSSAGAAETTPSVSPTPVNFFPEQSPH